MFERFEEIKTPVQNRLRDESMKNTSQYPEGTTKEQWDLYYEDLKRHEERVEREKPMEVPLYFTHYRPTPTFPTHAETVMEAFRIYHIAMAEWKMMRSCDAPNKPGYYRANND